MSKSKFHTIVDIPKYRWNTGYSVKNMFLGSCFTENIGNRMAELKYQVDVNPFGILYNPVSVANGLKILIQKKEFSSRDLIQTDGLWHSFYHHGRFSGIGLNETLNEINSCIRLSAENLREVGFIFITFGTSYVYRYKKTGQFVSNCHKIPAAEFERERLNISEITGLFSGLIREIKEINRDVKFVFTVSPIRHWKDGAVENQRSKAVLLLAIDEIIREFGADCCNYFPAYEIMMDELRDYRFYAEDMIHLSDVAVNHIWERFSESLIDEKSSVVSKKVNKIIQGINHRPIHRDSPEYVKFLNQMILQIDQLAAELNYINLTGERNFFIEQLTEIKTNSK